MLCLYKFILTDATIYNSVGDTSLINIWITTRQYQIRGLVYPFIYTIEDGKYEAPEGYNENEAKSALERYTYENIDENKKVIFFACQNLRDTRKGGKYVLAALDSFYNELTDEQRENILVILAGRAEKEIESIVKFNCKTFGFVDTNKLIKLYQAADVYLSGSVIDAGPMMVNQALSCAVPVVAFNIGTAIEVINGKNTGYVAKEISSEAFTEGLRWWYSLTNSEYKKISDNCRNIALETTSYEACSKKILETYEKL